MQGLSHSKLHVGQKTILLSHTLVTLLHMGSRAWSGYFDVNFANVDNLYFSLLEPYAHGFMHLGTLKDRL